MAAGGPFAAFKAAVLTITFFNFLAWLLLLGGISALESVCPGNCRASYGIPWFIIWFQFILIVPAFFVEFFDKYSAWRITIMLLLAINTVLSILQTEKLLNQRGEPGRGGTRVNAALAGFIILDIFNLLLIVLSGSRTAVNARYGDEAEVGVASYPSKPRSLPTPASSPQVTVPPSQSTYGTTAARQV